MVKTDKIHVELRLKEKYTADLEINFFLRDNVAPRSKLLGANWFDEGVKKNITNIKVRK